MNTKQAFEEAIEEKPDDWVLRLMYADWLDEHGDHDYAYRQRNWEKAHKYMSSAVMDEDWMGETPPREFTLNEMLDAGRSFLNGNDWWDLEPFIGGSSLTAESQIDPKEFWEAFHVLTGEDVQHVKSESPFQCCY